MAPFAGVREQNDSPCGTNHRGLHARDIKGVVGQTMFRVEGLSTQEELVDNQRAVITGVLDDLISQGFGDDSP